MELDSTICAMVRKLERRSRRGVFPFMVMPWLPVYRCEQSLRRDMNRLAERGRLVRVGGPEARRGYVGPVRGWQAS